MLPLVQRYARTYVHTDKWRTQCLWRPLGWAAEAQKIRSWLCKLQHTSRVSVLRGAGLMYGSGRPICWGALEPCVLLIILVAIRATSSAFLYPCRISASCGFTMPRLAGSAPGNIKSCMHTANSTNVTQLFLKSIKIHVISIGTFLQHLPWIRDQGCLLQHGATRSPTCLIVYLRLWRSFFLCCYKFLQWAAGVVVKHWDSRCIQEWSSNIPN